MVCKGGKHMNTPRKLRAKEIIVKAIKRDRKYEIIFSKTARTVMELLDETFGQGNWARRRSNDGKGCILSVFDEEHPEKGWVQREDVGSAELATFESEKTLSTDAFKRAATCWGIGRELYTAPHIIVDAASLVLDKTGELASQLYVSEVLYDGNRIASITIEAKLEGSKQPYFSARYTHGSAEIMIDKALEVSTEEYESEEEPFARMEGLEDIMSALSEIAVTEEEESVTEEVMETILEEEPAMEEVTEAILEEEPVTKEVTEAILEEEPVMEEVTEAILEEELVTEEVTESVLEEEPVTEEITEAVLEEGPVTEEVTESVLEEEPVTEEVTETTLEEEPVMEEDEIPLIAEDEILVMGNCKGLTFGEAKKLPKFQSLLKWISRTNTCYPNPEQQRQFDALKKMALSMDI